jgi:Domain of unknown function (DUF4037)
MCARRVSPVTVGGMTPPFVPGLELSRLFYEDAVRPILAASFPRLVYSAARIGSGSEVLGYDTARSADHEWGPRLELFLAEGDLPVVGERLRQLLSEQLPKEFLGWSTNFGPEDAVVRSMELTDGPVRHRVGVGTVASWCDDRLGFDAQAGVTTFDWLATSGQRLAETTGGAVFHDGLAEVAPLRKNLNWYPQDVWRFLLASQWQRVAQEEAFPGRCAEVGDDLGSRVVTARLVRDLMRLCLLMARRYVPYSKWLGSAFADLPCAADVGPALGGAVEAPTSEQREAHLCVGYEHIAKRHNALRLTPPLDVSPRGYHGRPFQVIDGGRFATALRESLGDAGLAALPLVGSVDQFVDSTEVLSDLSRARAVAGAILGSVL